MSQDTKQMPRTANKPRQQDFVLPNGSHSLKEISAAQQIAQEPASTVAKRYHFIEHESYMEQGSVSAFLDRHPDIANILLDAVPAIEKVFGAGTGLTLQVLVDQDGENDTSLFARIRTSKPVREAIALKKQFYREWWMKQAQALEAPLNFEVETA